MAFQVTICILTIPYAIERVALQWLSMLLAHTKLDEDLQAAHTVITSSSDAQGELDKDLRLLEVGLRKGIRLRFRCPPSWLMSATCPDLELKR